jgi:hypothetical protein
VLWGLMCAFGASALRAILGLRPMVGVG